ncbi:phage tail protein [Vibrio metschnikovii]|uniref:Phage tail protein n=1 Tax=bacterium 19PA01SH03 TaxID=2920705 RepID=A0AAU6SQX9_UNCXX|nr:phage tail protein [Vibrio metschnikovii]EKO3731129.1 phage tail protein [Vibrio metschnikovii]EKO3754758.1 phage tail protein [Vibrio metschnikovii]
MSTNEGYAVTITAHGLSELISAKEQGMKGRIKWISFGDRAYTPSVNQRRLQNEIDRATISEYVDVGTSALKMTAKVESGNEYAVREIGFWLDTGTLLGVISVPNKTLNYKTATTSLIQIFTLDLSVLPSSSVEVVIGIENLNILIDTQMMSDAVAFCRSQLTQTKQLFAHLKLSERVQKMELSNG